MKKFIIFLAIISFQIIEAQSPWTREKGKTFIQVGFTGLFYDKIQFDGNEFILQNKVSDLTIQAYTEYGINNKLEAQLIIPFKSVGLTNKIFAISQQISGIGNVSLGLKYKLYDKKWKVSTGLMFAANSINKDQNIDLSTGFNANTFLPYITTGSSTGKWYYFAKLAYGYMDNNYSDFINTTFEVGYEVVKNGHVIFVLDTRNIVSKESAFTNDVLQWSSYLDRQAYNAFGIKGNYEFKKVKFGANFAIIGAAGINNAPLAPTLNFGLYSKL